MDGSDMRFEGYHVETREHAGEYPDTMPQVIEVTDGGRRHTCRSPETARSSTARRSWNG